MQVFTDFSDYQSGSQSWVVALGNFDGVHKGHQAVIQRAKILAKKLGAKTAVVTFEPHPKRYFSPNLAPFRLTPRKTKRFFINQLGVDAIFELEFNTKLAQMEAHDFVKDIIVGQLNAVAVVTGYDFHFGKNRKGTPQSMAAMAKEFGFDYICIDAITDENGVSWSASRIRQALANGDVDETIQILGRPFMFQGEVIHGQALGRTIGFPTANVLPSEYLRPMRGVYAVKAKIIGEDIWRDAIANIGNRPTVEGEHHTLIEVHLLDWEGDLYGKKLRTALLGFVRKEKKFDGIESLKQQIEKDVTVTKEILAQYVPNSLMKK